MPFSHELNLSLREWLREEIERDALREEIEHRGARPSEMRDIDEDQSEADRWASDLLQSVMRENGIGPEEAPEPERPSGDRATSFGLDHDGYPPGFRG